MFRTIAQIVKLLNNMEEEEIVAEYERLKFIAEATAKDTCGDTLNKKRLCENLHKAANYLERETGLEPATSSLGSCKKDK